MRVKFKSQKRYNIIYADPPWTWKAWSKKGEGRSPSKHYTLLNNADIAALPISRLAAKDCTLFLWVTGPLLHVGLDTLIQWGFDYKTIAFAWAKQTVNGHWHMGNGYYTRANIELCLLGTRGNPKVQSHAVRQLLPAQVGEHSAKPPEVRERIVQLLGNVPRVELFARTRVDGWDSYGLEIDGRDIREVLK